MKVPSIRQFDTKFPKVPSTQPSGRVTPQMLPFKDNDGVHSCVGTIFRELEAPSPILGEYC